MSRLFAICIIAFISSFSPFSFASLSTASWEHEVIGIAPSSDHSDIERHVRDQIMDEFFLWQGTHYLYGGNTHKGIDCSAFTRTILYPLTHRRLPRTALEQSHKGIFVSRNHLRTGDLVFFMTKPNTRHVGIYVGHNQFIHASSSRGVTLSALTNAYWQAHYLTARRVV